MTGDTDAPELSVQDLDAETSRLFFELPFIGMAVTSPGNKRWLRVNQSLCEMLGYTREQLLNKTWTELTHPEDRKRDVAQFDDIMRGASDGHKQNKRYFHKDGTVVHTVIDVKAVRREDGSVKFFVATISDVTAQINAETAARDSAALMTKLAQQVPGVLYQLEQGADGAIRFPFASEHLRSIFELSPDQVRHDASLLVARIHTEDRASFMDSLKASAETGTPWLCDYRVAHSQLGLRYIHNEAHPEASQDGRILWHGIATDITNQKLQQLALQESEERYRLQDEHAPDAIVTYDPGDQGFTGANSQAVSMFGLPRPQLLQLGWRDISPELQPDGSNSAQSGEAWAQRALAGQAATFEWNFKGPCEDLIPTQVRLTRLPHQGAYLLRASITDIREQVAKERALRTSEERLQQAIRCSQVGIFDHDHLQGTLFWSPEMHQIYDVPPENGASLSLLKDRLHPDDRDDFAQQLSAIQDPSGMGTMDGQFRIIWSNGEVRRLSARAQTSFTEMSGSLAPARTIGAVTDVTDAWRAQETLLTLQTAVESSLSMVAMANLKGQLTYANRAFLDLWGYTQQTEVLGRHVSGFWRSQGKSAEVIAAVRNKGIWMGERVAQRSDGTERNLQISVSLFRDSSGNPAGMLGSFVDITEAKLLQAQLLQSQKLESIGRLAGGIAHDFNNLLTVIRGYVDLAQLSLPDGHGVETELAEVERAAKLAASLTQQLLAFSRRQIIEPVVLDLNAVVQRANGMLTRVLGEQIELAVHPGEDLWLVRFDPGQAEQILLNLAVNARDAMPQSGRLSLETSNVVLEADYQASHPGAQAGEFVMLAVSDTGAGMDAETLLHAFEPFYTTKNLGQGTGLGLSVIHGAVSQNGGRVEVYSEPGHGTSFKIYLPRTQGPEAPAGTADLLRPPTGDETVLLTEDDDGVRQLAVVMLQSFGYRVHDFSDPGEALNWLKQHPEPVHALVTDVIMPGMNGKELADQVLAERPGTKVLFVSGYTANVIVTHGVLKPGVQFLAKPYSRESLANRLREVLDS